MSISRRRFVTLALGATTVLQTLGSVMAETYPSRQVRVVIPAPAGGGTDVLGRLFSQKLGEIWGQSVIPENKPGGGGNIGGQLVARATPDGYTLLMTYGGVITMNPYLYADQGFDPLKDLTPVTMLASASYLLCVHPSVQANSVEELIAMAKANPRTLTWASGPIGTPDHLSGKLLELMADVEMVSIPYKGASEAVLDVLAGRIGVTFLTIPTALPHLKAGTLRPLGLSATQRSPLLPDVPTIAESGVPGYEMSTWYGFFVPAGTPASIRDKLVGDLQAVLEMEEVRSSFATRGFVEVGSTASEFSNFIADESQKYEKIVKAAGMQKN